MKLYKVLDPAPGIVALEQRLMRELLLKKQVLWLIPGGSNIPASVEVMQAIPDELTSGLTILLTDERYGPPGHSDSNWQQLQERGFDPKHAKATPVLQDRLSLEATRTRYDQLLAKAFRKADYIIGQFGVGADGHIAGILPQSPATEATDFAAAYLAAPYERITMTFPAIKHLNLAFVMAFGVEKQQALEDLADKSLDPSDQPVQIIKQLPQAEVYNDCIGNNA